MIDKMDAELALPVAHQGLHLPISRVGVDAPCGTEPEEL